MLSIPSLIPRSLIPVTAALAALMSGTVQAQGAATFPVKPVTIVLPFTPGASTDRQMEP